jgi:hypothetical protein
MGLLQHRVENFNWSEIPTTPHDLSMLDTPFTEQEVFNAIRQMPKDKSPGPMAFFASCWDIIKHELMAAIQSFYDQRTIHLAPLNSANIVVIPKKEGTEKISDYQPISLIDGVAKIITKILALRLQPYMNQLISNNQSVFIKKRAIHDNFMYVRNLARYFNISNIPTLLVKLDIAKAFDSVHWEYMI